ncbi:GRF zinc finger containing protein [Striga asiatica]|uniref:GRF zinc finger containing protein n=1 Tax=Striga asiatica TaxID=4170 RepID=A0A5A7RE86_STRAF|nr:GRF zinc finger containing protein [Striga asiatica]
MATMGSEVTGNGDFCTCEKRAVMKTSWTDHNPGRRYAVCEKPRAFGGCNYFSWIDPPMCPRSRQIIPGLLRRVNRLEDELATKKSREKWLWGMMVLSWLIMFFVKW